MWSTTCSCYNHDSNYVGTSKPWEVEGEHYTVHQGVDLCDQEVALEGDYEDHKVTWVLDGYREVFIPIGQKK